MTLLNLIKKIKDFLFSSESDDFEFYDEHLKKGVIYADFDGGKNILSVTYDDRSVVKYYYDRRDDNLYLLPLVTKLSKSQNEFLRGIYRFINYHRKPYEIIHS